MSLKMRVNLNLWEETIDEKREENDHENPSIGEGCGYSNVKEAGEEKLDEENTENNVINSARLTTDTSTLWLT